MNASDIVSIIENEQLDENDIVIVSDALRRKQSCLIASTRVKVELFLGARDNLKAASLDRVAEKFCVSSRTLHRRLGKENTKFSRLVDNERKKRCYCLMKEHALSGVKLACLLGFTDPASFYSKFEHWTGCRFSDAKRSLAENPQNIVQIFDVQVGR